MTVHTFDAAGAACIDETAAARFGDDGFLLLRHVLCPDELAALRRQTAALIQDALAGRGRSDDLRYDQGPRGEKVLSRIEYVVDKLDAAKVLLGHPFLLRTVERLQGPFIPTWDSMVFKLPGGGGAVPWHRDSGLYPGEPDLLSAGRVFNVDIYLDRADLSSCVWGVPGSNHWDDERARREIGRLNAGGVQTGGTVPLQMEPGDVLLHNVAALHGSKATTGPLRRVIYYEFRPVEIELAHGPHVPEYIPLKKHVLAGALHRRRSAPYAAGEEPFGHEGAAASDPPGWRYPHEDYWRG